MLFTRWARTARSKKSSKTHTRPSSPSPASTAFARSCAPLGRFLCPSRFVSFVSFSFLFFFLRLSSPFLVHLLRFSPLLLCLLSLETSSLSISICIPPSPQALCGISTGIFGYPLYKASTVACRVVRQWLESPSNQKKVA